MAGQDRIKPGEPAEGEARQAFDRSRDVPRTGSLVLLLGLALALLVMLAGLINAVRADSYLVALLAVLGGIGVLALFAVAAGLVRLAGRAPTHPLLKTVVDNEFDGVVVTDARGQVVYANVAYLDLIAAASANEVRPIEQVFIGDPEVSESIYRLLKAAREGRRLEDEVRLASKPGEAARWLRLRVRPLDAAKLRRTDDGVVDRRGHARARAAGECLSGTAARHRLSRPRPGRLLLGR